MSNRVNVEIDSIHSRAICKEIGERLRISLSRESPELPHACERNWISYENRKHPTRRRLCLQSSVLATNSKLRRRTDWFSGLSDGLVGNGLDTIQVVGQFAHPLARRVGVGALGRLLKGGADVSDDLESKGAPGTPHLVP